MADNRNLKIILKKVLLAISTFFQIDQTKNFIAISL